jgi:hypothetical protein
MLKYLSKMTMDILPSVVATILGAYIVNHYIATKPGTGTEAPVAAVAAPAEPKKADAAAIDTGNLPAAGVRAKGISEKAIFEKSSEKVQEKAREKAEDKQVEKAAEKRAEKAVEKSAEKPAVAEKTPEPETETASISADTRRRASAPHEKPLRVIPLTAAAQPAAPVTAPATLEAAVTPDDHRDANDLARAAIERLRGGSETAPRVQETVRLPEAAPRTTASIPQTPVPPATAIQVPGVRPLPPPISVSTPPADSLGPVQTQPAPMTARADDPRRPIPPADIPSAAPVDLHAGAVDEPARPHHTNVAEDMLLAAKSVFHSVIPQ